MCVDYIDLNKACSKDHFSLLQINHLVNNTLGHQLLCFMDAFSRYIQIMAAIETKKLARITESVTYRYNVILQVPHTSDLVT